jgi:acetylornithine deacetylase/succinyl-diaminopimelate desuccinylase-like protein
MTDHEPADPVRVLRDLIGIETGRDCLDHVAGVLPGVEHADDSSLVLRIPGRGAAQPLLVHGTASDKHGLAMVLAALLRLDARGERPSGDVMLAVVADGKHGAKHLVDEHTDLFTGIRCAIGRHAGADIRLPGVGFHPIVVAEKRACLVRVTIDGADGDAALLAPSDSPVAQLGMLLTALSGARLARRRTPVVERMLDALAAALPDDGLSAAVHRLGTDHANDRVPASLPLSQALFLDSLMRNTANPVAVRTEAAAGRTPGRVSADIDCRLLPGVGTDAFLAELRTFTGSAEVEVLHEDPVSEAKPEFGPFYDRLVEVLTKADPEGVPLPVLTPGSTEAVHYSRLGIRCYGWLPLHLSEGSLSHRALRFGADRMTELLRDFP